MRAAFVLLVLAGLLGGLWWSQGKGGVRTITQGRVYQSGVLSAEDLRRVVRQQGIRSVIDLRQPLEEVQPEIAVLSALGVKHIHIPSAQVTEDAAVKRFVEVMSDPATYPVLIHCQHGIGRSVLFSAIYRVEFEGWDREQARQASLRPIRRIVPGGTFAVNGPKGSYLLGYMSPRDTVASAPEPGSAQALR
ncbi:MAG: dual specificity protein phosphatase family protein [Burkholderiales bacterium]